MLQISKPPFGFIYISVSNGFASAKTYEKLVNFDFDLVFFTFWMVMFSVVPLMGFTFHNLLGLAKANK